MRRRGAQPRTVQRRRRACLGARPRCAAAARGLPPSATTAAPRPAASLRSAVAAQADAVVLAPHGAAAGARLGVQVALALQAAELLARAGQAAQLAVLVHGVADPVDARVLRGGMGCRERRWARRQGAGPEARKLLSTRPTFAAHASRAAAAAFSAPLHFYELNTAAGRCGCSVAVSLWHTPCTACCPPIAPKRPVDVMHCPPLLSVECELSAAHDRMTVAAAGRRRRGSDRRGGCPLQAARCPCAGRAMRCSLQNPGAAHNRALPPRGPSAHCPGAPCGWPCARGPPGSPRSTCTPRPAQVGGQGGAG